MDLPIAIKNRRDEMKMNEAASSFSAETGAGRHAAFLSTTMQKSNTKPSDSAGPKRILVVYGKTTALMTLSIALRTDAVEVLTTGRLETAEDVLERHRFDLVIAESRMPGILEEEGLELLCYIKRRWPQTKVIIVADSGSEEIRKEAHARGVDYYHDMKQPADYGELFQRVRSMGIPVKMNGKNMDAGSCESPNE